MPGLDEILVLRDPSLPYALLSPLLLLALSA
jgi:hypothetical protein